MCSGLYPNLVRVDYGKKKFKVGPLAALKTTAVSRDMVTVTELPEIRQTLVVAAATLTGGRLAGVNVCDAFAMSCNGGLRASMHPGHHPPSPHFPLILHFSASFVEPFAPDDDQPTPKKTNSSCRRITARSTPTPQASPRRGTCSTGGGRTTTRCVAPRGGSSSTTSPRRRRCPCCCSAQAILTPGVRE